MADDNQMIEKPKLGFFGRMRKRFLINFINEKRFENAGELAEDDDVIDAYLEKYPEKIKDIRGEKRARAILRNLNLLRQLNIWEKRDWVIKHFDEIDDGVTFFKSLDHEIKVTLLNEKPELIVHVENPLAYISENLTSNIKNCIAFLPQELQLRILQEEVSYDIGKSVTPSKFESYLKCFLPEVVEQFYIIMLEKIKKNEGRNSYHNIDIYRADLKDLPEELQLKLAIMDNRLLAQMSPEVVEKFINNNPAVYLSLPKDIRGKFSNLSNKIRLLDEDVDERHKRLAEIVYNPRYVKFKNLEEAKKLCIYGFKRFRKDYGNLSLAMQQISDIYEFGKICPDIYYYNDASFGGDITRNIKRRKSLETFKNKTSSDRIRTSIDNRIARWDDKNGDDLWNIAKLMTNSAVLEHASEDKIAEFISNPSMELMREIIIEVYGEENRAIFENRPLLNMEKIPNLFIFDPIVKDVFGMDFVNDLLTYEDITTPMIIADMVNNPEKFKEFQKFESIIGDIYPDTTYGIVTKLSAFYELEDLISKINLNQLSDKQIENLKQIVLDKKYQGTTALTNFIPLETIEDLDAYQDRKNDILNEAIQKCTDLKQIKNLIFERFFGLTYYAKYDTVFDKENISANQLIIMYNLESFLSDERTINSELFSQEELDSLEILSIISKINDVDVLLQLYETLEKTNLEILNPRDFKKIRDKIPIQYSKEFMDSLLTLEKAEEMVKNGEQGIDIEVTDDGVSIVKLHGANFRMFMHSTGLNNSGLALPRGMGIEELWKCFEHGVSTISGCPIEGDMLKSCSGSLGINMGFFSIPPELIAGMSHKDAHVTHSQNTLNPMFDYGNISFNYPEELVRKIAAQVNGSNGESKDPTHEYGEVTSLRQEAEVIRGSHEQRNRRIMPDCIIVYGKGKTTQNIIELAKRFSKDGKPIPIFEIDVKEYGDRSYRRAYQQENHTSTREESDTIKEIKDISNGQDRGDR